jgi:hypothetical protein
VLDYFSDNSMDGKLLLFNRIQKICGLKFTHRVNEEFSKHKNCWVARGEQPLVFTAHPSHTSAYWRRADSHPNRQDDTDLEEIGLRVKHMNIISYAQGHCLHLKGNMAWNNNPINAQRFFNMAMEKYEGQKPYARALPRIPSFLSPSAYAYGNCLFSLLSHNNRGAKQRALVERHIGQLRRDCH